MNKGISTINQKKVILFVCVCSIITLATIGIIAYALPDPEFQSQSLSNVHLNSSVMSELKIQSESNTEIYCNEYNTNLDQISWNIIYNINIENQYNSQAGIHIQTSISAYIDDNLIDSINLTQILFSNNDSIQFIHTINFSSFNMNTFSSYINKETKCTFVLYTSIITYRANLEPSIADNSKRILLTLKPSDVMGSYQSIGIIGIGCFGISMLALASIQKKSKKCIPLNICNPYKDKCCNQ